MYNVIARSKSKKKPQLPDQAVQAFSAKAQEYGSVRILLIEQDNCRPSLQAAFSNADSAQRFRLSVTALQEIREHLSIRIPPLKMVSEHSSTPTNRLT